MTKFADKLAAQKDNLQAGEKTISQLEEDNAKRTKEQTSRVRSNSINANNELIAQMARQAKETKQVIKPKSIKPNDINSDTNDISINHC